MKCEQCNGTGVINTALTGHTPTTPCPNCDHGNLQLRLDHRFQPVIEEHVQLLRQIEACGREPNPILAELPFEHVEDTSLADYMRTWPDAQLPALRGNENQDMPPFKHYEDDVPPLKGVQAAKHWKPTTEWPKEPLMPMQASEQNMSPGPGLSTPPRRCNEDLRLEGKPYPRSCADCGLGPCKWPLQPGSVPVSKVTPLKLPPKMNARIEGKPVTDDEAREWASKHPHLIAAKMPTAVQDRDAAIAQVHAEFARAGLCVVPVDVLRDAADALNHGNEVEQLSAEKELRKHLPKE